MIITFSRPGCLLSLTLSDREMSTAGVRIHTTIYAHRRRTARGGLTFWMLIIYILVTRDRKRKGLFQDRQLSDFKFARKEIHDSGKEREKTS